MSSSQFKVELGKSVLVTAFELRANREKIDHLSERLKSLELVKKFLKTRKYFSPKSKVESQLLENKVEEIYIETLDVKKKMSLSEEKIKK